MIAFSSLSVTFTDLKCRPSNLLTGTFLAGLFWSLYSITIPQVAQGQISQATIKEILDGNEVFVQEKIANLDDTANFGEVILTKQSRAGLIFNNGAKGRLGEQAKVTVGQCVEVEQGEILVSGSVTGCMAGLTVSVKGTLYVLKKTEQDSGTVEVLEGTVQVQNNQQPGETIEIKAGEKIELLQGILGQVIPLSPEEIVAILNGQLFTGFTIPVTPEGALQEICSRLLPGLSCSTTGLPSYPIPTPPIPIPLPSLPF